MYKTNERIKINYFDFNSFIRFGIRSFNTKKCPDKKAFPARELSARL